MDRRCIGVGTVRGMAWTVCGLLLLALNMPATASGTEETGTWTHKAEFCPNGETDDSSGFRFWTEGFPANQV
jgi:hypothetical protein